ncbi:MAG: hypothetical protein FRX49_05788 [Trebouxia sp. A1-2]|nr:MAG: hypothetical protein FRX49_05788 [Trebouxia sp. A1-2]
MGAVATHWAYSTGVHLADAEWSVEETYEKSQQLNVRSAAEQDCPAGEQSAAWYTSVYLWV